MTKKGHEIAKIPEDIGKTDEEEDDVGDSSGCADGQKNGKDKVDEDYDESDIRVDRQYHLLHRCTPSAFSNPGRMKIDTLSVLAGCYVLCIPSVGDRRESSKKERE